MYKGHKLAITEKKRIGELFFWFIWLICLDNDDIFMQHGSNRQSESFTFSSARQPRHLVL